MKIKTTRQFDKSFKKLPEQVKKVSEKKIGDFIDDPKNPVLRDHALKGKMKGKRSFSIKDDYRLVYRKTENGEVIFLFMNIGTHSKVYR